MHPFQTLFDVYMRLIYYQKRRTVLTVQKHLKKEDLSRRVARLRRSLGLSQDELAHLIGLNRASLQKIENGTTVDLKTTTLVALSETFKVSIEYLVYGDEGSSLDQAKISALLRLLDPASTRTLLATAQALADMSREAALNQKKSRA